MKKVFRVVLCLLLIVVATGCGGKTQEKEVKNDEPVNLYGEWKQTNSNSAEAYQEATIKEDGTITINWVDEEDNSKSLYWAGSFDAPTTNSKSYSWISKNDKEQTDSAILASGDDTKEFKYSNGIISYEASAMGTTMTIKMEKK